MFSRRAASEFPNDNPELHDGLVWTSESPCGAPVPTLRLRPLSGRLPKVLGPSWAPVASTPAPEPALPAAPVLAPAHPDDAPAAPAIAADAGRAPSLVTSPSREPPVEMGAADALVQALVRVLLERGATRAAAELPGLLADGRGEPDASPGLARLLSAGAVWRSVLDGKSDDLAACGDQPLDAWGAELLSALVGDPAERETLRRALRRKGVAAFGMLRAA